MTVDANRVQSVFLKAVEVEDLTARASILDQECAADSELRQQVESLLQVHGDLRRRKHFNQPTLHPEVTPGTGPSTPTYTGVHGTSENIGDIIGPYKLLQRLGEGGMGVVWVAEQSEPVRRHVALKVIKAGMDSTHFIARFEQERQALALMDHPNIARVFDAGETATGLPYFVMELVNGMTITKYCDQESLTPSQRLELFVAICQAVQHAHQKGIIHRDLKPSNILIALYDGHPVPKVIDFGVAKATGQKLTERTMFTEVGSIIGTLEYMAPEQIELNNLDIDTRADIYSLGVVLYELLTGSPPFTAKQLRSAAFLEMLRLIRDVEPPKPSTKLSTSDELPNIAAKRKLEPNRLTKLVHGDLDWIVMKCLEKDRCRRYDSAAGLAQDVLRYLADEPVLAGPPSARYRLRKFLRRNRGPVLAAALVLIALLGGIIGTTWGLIREQHARAAEAQRAAEAAEQAAIAAAVNDFLQTDLLRQADSEEQALHGFTADPNLTMKEALTRAAKLIGDRFQHQPLVEAAIRHAIGDAYRGIGDPKSAVPHYERARHLRSARLGADHPDTLSTLNNLGCVFQDSGELDKAQTLFEETVEKRTAVLGADHADTLIASSNLAGVYRDHGKIDKALSLSEQLLVKFKERFGPEHTRTMVAKNNLALTYNLAGYFNKSVPLYEETLTQQKAILGADHPHTLQTMNNLALAYGSAGQPEKALALTEQTLGLIQQRHGPDHPRTLITTNNLAVAYFNLGQHAKALPLFERLLEQQSAKEGPDHPSTLSAMSNLAFVYKAAGQVDRARHLQERTLAKRKEKLGPEHPETLQSMNNLAHIYVLVGLLPEATALFEEILTKQKDRLGLDHPETFRTMDGLAQAYQLGGQLEKAVSTFEQALARRQIKLGSDHPDSIGNMANLGNAYGSLGQLDKAVALLEESLSKHTQKLRPEHPDTLSCMHNLGRVYLLSKQPEKAERVLLVCLAGREKIQPDAWTTFQTKSVLGGAVADLQRYNEAERLLLQGYEGMIQREAKIPATGKARLSEAAERLVQLYQAWGKLEQAEQWRAKIPAKLPNGNADKPEENTRKSCGSGSEQAASRSSMLKRQTPSVVEPA